MLPPLSYVECCMLCVCARVLISSTPRQSPFKRATRTHACMHLRTVSHLSYAIGSHTAQPKSTHTWADWPPLQQHQQQPSNSFSLLLEYVIALVCVFCWTHTKAIMQYIYLFVCTFIRAETNTLQTPWMPNNGSPAYADKRVCVCVCAYAYARRFQSNRELEHMLLERGATCWRCTTLVLTTPCVCVRARMDSYSCVIEAEKPVVVVVVVVQPQLCCCCWLPLWQDT